MLKSQTSIWSRGEMYPPSPTEMYLELEINQYTNLKRNKRAHQIAYQTMSMSMKSSPKSTTLAQTWKSVLAMLAEDFDKSTEGLWKITHQKVGISKLGVEGCGFINRM